MPDRRSKQAFLVQVPCATLEVLSSLRARATLEECQYKREVQIRYLERGQPLTQLLAAEMEPQPSSMLHVCSRHLQWRPSLWAPSGSRSEQIGSRSCVARGAGQRSLDGSSLANLWAQPRSHSHRRRAIATFGRVASAAVASGAKPWVRTLHAVPTVSSNPTSAQHASGRHRRRLFAGRARLGVCFTGIL